MDDNRSNRAFPELSFWDKKFNFYEFKGHDLHAIRREWQAQLAHECCFVFFWFESS